MLTHAWRSPFFQALCRSVWAGAVVSLPLTSLPLLVDLSGASTVAPPAVVLLAVLALIWLGPYSLQGGELPAEVRPLIAFGGVAVVTWAAAFFIELPPFRDKSLLSEAREAFLTLAMGLITYLTVAAYAASSSKTLQLSLKLLNWSGLAVMLWSSVQAIFAFFHRSMYPDVLLAIQNLFVARHAPLFFARVTGLAYEPSWLAHQLNLVYLPVWLAASLCGYSAHARKLWRFSLENFLLVGGALQLFLSFSRVGWVSFLMVGAFVAVSATLRLVQRITNALLVRWKLASAQRLLRLALSGGLLAAFAVAYAAAALGLAFLGAQLEPRLGRIFAQDWRQAGGFFELTNQLAFAERVVYWASGFDVFGEHPFLGVGLGNAGFYFAEKMPAYGHGLVEVVNLFNRQSFVPNTKSLWVRLLAETGLMGFAVFAAWLVVLWQAARLARYAHEPLLRMLGAAGQFALIAFLVEGFSVDSLALPYLWFAAGMLSAAAYLSRRPAAESLQGIY